MELQSLLQKDQDAAAFFTSLPKELQGELRRRGGNISSLAALREYAIDLTNQWKPSEEDKRVIAKNGIPLDPELAAEWTREHQV